MSSDMTIHDLRETEDRRDLIHQAVAVIARGGKVGVIHPGGYLRVLVSATSTNGIGPELLQISGSDLSLTVPHLDSLKDWLNGPGRLASRLARKAWPGRLRIAVEGDRDSGLYMRLPRWLRHAVQSQGYWTFDCPASETIRAMIPLVPGPLLQISMQLGRAQPEGIEGIAKRLEPIDLDMALVDGTHEASVEPAIVLIRDERAEVLSRGDIGEDQLRWLMGTRILFVCTGNTCRSPMAEAICKLMLAERLGCPVVDLPAMGYEVLSAGVSAGRNQPASSESIEALGEFGRLLENHASRMVCEELLRSADLVYAMTQSHRDVLVMEFPEMADRVELLDPDDYDVPDPYGQHLSVYRMTVDAIREALELRAGAWTFLPPGPGEGESA
ncbi:hypothetical protein GC170_12430 [bacterium]|nr:hypothetical protein [bacterium]